MKPFSHLRVGDRFKTAIGTVCTKVSDLYGIYANALTAAGLHITCTPGQGVLAL